MRLLRPLAALVAGFATALCAATASAQTVPVRVIDRDVVLPANVTELRVDARFGLSRGSAGDIVILAPSLSYGFSDKFTLSILHTRENYVGDGGSFCVGRACGGDHYGQVALDGKYLILSDKSASLAINGAVEAYNFDPFVFGIRGGVAGKIRATDDVALLFQPTIFLGVTNRDGRPDSMVLPLRVQLKVDEHFAPFFDTGLYFDNLGHLSDTWRLPIGAGFIYAANTTVDIGARFAFLGLLNGYPHVGAFDGRELVGTLALHL